MAAVYEWYGIYQSTTLHELILIYAKNKGMKKFSLNLDENIFLELILENPFHVFNQNHTTKN